MRRIRIFALGIVSFFAVLMGTLLAPGTFVNRALSAALCTVFSFSSTLCTVNLAKSSDRVVAATPPAVERNISDWLVQRDPGEFDDAPSAPSGSNPQAPPFPQDPGPNQPVRPDFDNEPENRGVPNAENTPQEEVFELDLGLAKESEQDIWVFALYESLENQTPFLSFPMKLRAEDLPSHSGANSSSPDNVNVTYDHENRVLFSYIQDSNQRFISSILQDEESEEKIYLLAVPLGRQNAVKSQSNWGDKYFNQKAYYNHTNSRDKYFNQKVYNIARIPESERRQALKKETLKLQDQSRNNQLDKIRKDQHLKLIKNQIPPRLQPLAIKGAKLVKQLQVVFVGATGAAIAFWIISDSQNFSKCIKSVKCVELVGKLLGSAYGAPWSLPWKEAWNDMIGGASPSTGSAPVVTNFTCNGGKTCTVGWGSSVPLMFTYEDKDGNASSWEVSGYTIGNAVGKGTISPPNGSGTINSKVRCVGSGSGGPKDSSNSVTVTDVTGLKSNSLSVTVKCH